VHPCTTWVVSGWSKPRAGEPASGDFWLSLAVPGLQLTVLADVLGHGPKAATDAESLRRTIQAAQPGSLAQVYEAVELAAANTRGCALFLAALHPDHIHSVSVGNIRAWLVHQQRVTALPREPGVVGRNRHQPRQHMTETPAGTWLVACSDGIRSGFCPDITALQGRTPLEAARWIVERWSIPEDDATCLVALNRQRSGGAA